MRVLTAAAYHRCVASWIYVLLTVALLIARGRNRPAVLALGSSGLLYTLSTFVGSVACDFRYNWWSIVAALVLLVVIAVRLAMGIIERVIDLVWAAFVPLSASASRERARSGAPALTRAPFGAPREALRLRSVARPSLALTPIDRALTRGWVGRSTRGGRRDRGRVPLALGLVARVADRDAELLQAAVLGVHVST
jgi:hypothetical protein